MERDFNFGDTVKDAFGFYIRRFFGKTSYLKGATGGRKIWVTRSNPTAHCEYYDKWAVFVTGPELSKDREEPKASGFTTHQQAKQWAVDNIPA